MDKNRFARWTAVLVFVVAAGNALHAQARPRIGLALSGGGAKGCAHVGVLRQLERMHIPVDYIAGTSMGAIVGALYASGMSPEEIEKELTTGIDWEEAMTDATAFEHLTYRRKLEEMRYPSTIEAGVRDGKLVVPSGIRTGQKLSFLLARYLLPHLDQRDFSKLPIPYAAVATDLETGEPFVLKEGDMADAVKASMSIPGAFTPVEWNGRLLVDGGVTMNVPVEVVRGMGADIVIAVDIAAGLGTRDKLNSTLGIVGQLSNFLTRKNMEPQLAAADLVLSPDIRGYETLDFSKAAEIVKRGDAEAIAKEDQLRKYSIDPAEHQALVQSRRVPRKRELRIDAIRVEGARFVDERIIRDQMETAPGEILDLDKLQKDVEWMYGWADFTGIHFGVDTTAGTNTLVLRVHEKPWGPAYVRTGIGVETHYNRPGVFLLLNHTRRWVNARGAEWRNDVELGNDWGLHTEFYQPRGFDKIGFFAVGGGYERRFVRAFRDESAVGQYQIRKVEAALDGGTLLGTAGEVRLGVFYAWNDADLEIGEEPAPDFHDNGAGIRGRLNLNTTDDPFFPNHGGRLDFELIAPLGSATDYVMGDLRGAWYGSMDRHVFSGVLTLHEAFNGDTPIYDTAVLGGLGNLSGYPYGLLIGQAAAVIGAGYRNRVTRIPGLADGVYVGVLAEAGDVYPSLSDFDFSDLRGSATFFIGVDTSYGPLFLAAAKAEDTPAQYYLQIGRSF